MNTPQVQWGRGPIFAEAAEVVGVRTNQVMALMEFKGVFHVFYTPYDEPGQEERVFLAHLVRDKDGIMRLRGRIVEQVGMIEEMEQGLKDHMERKLNEEDTA